MTKGNGPSRRVWAFIRAFCVTEWAAPSPGCGAASPARFLQVATRETAPNLIPLLLVAICSEQLPRRAELLVPKPVVFCLVSPLALISLMVLGWDFQAHEQCIDRRPQSHLGAANGHSALKVGQGGWPNAAPWRMLARFQTSQLVRSILRTLQHLRQHFNISLFRSASSTSPVHTLCHLSLRYLLILGFQGVFWGSILMQNQRKYEKNARKKECISNGLGS